MNISIKAAGISIEIRESMLAGAVNQQLEFVQGQTSEFADAPAENCGHLKIFDDGSSATASDPRTDHVAVIDHTTGLMWSVASLGNPDKANEGIPQEQCAKRCTELRLLGHDDWRLPTHDELAGLVDVSRREPAIDTKLFPHVLPRWHWTSTPLINSDGTASASVAWGVYFNDGDVNSYLRGFNGFALAVRRAGQ